MTLELRTLRHLVALARRLSYARAAEDLNITQPTLTRSIQTLEAQLGLRIFDRDRAGVSVTPQGQAVVDRAIGLVGEADDLERFAYLTSQGKAGKIRFGMAPMAARVMLSDALQDQIVASPDITFRVVVRNADALWPLLVSREIDFFVSTEGQILEDARVRIDTLGRIPMSLIVRDGHPLLEGKCGTERFPLLVGGNNGILALQDLAKQTHATINVVEDYETLTRLTMSTNSIWLTSSYSVCDEILRGSLKELPRAMDIYRIQPATPKMIFYTLERRSQTQAVQRLKQTMRNRIKYLTTVKILNSD
jgi:DNA-binding transcriptional LysR family regulator